MTVTKIDMFLLTVNFSVTSPENQLSKASSLVKSLMFVLPV